MLTGAWNSAGGIATVNRLTLRALGELGYSREVLALLETNELNSAQIPEGLAGHYRCFNGSKPRFSVAAWKALIFGSYNLVMADHINLASILAPLKLLKKLHYVVWLFGIEAFPPRPDWQGRFGLKAAGCCLAISEYTRRRVLEQFPHLDIRVVELALDPERHPRLDRLEVLQERPNLFLQAEDGNQHPLSEQVILHVGRMEANEMYKGQDSLLWAFPSIADHHPTAQLVLVGDGSDKPRLQRIAQRLPDHLRSRVFMPGYITDELLDHLYRVCFLFAMPSWGEGFGLVYLEAMARARPCIGSRVDAAQSVIQDEKTGLLVNDPRDPEQVAAKIVELLDNPHRANQMGKAGYQRVQAYYLFPHFKERLRRALET